MSRRVPMICCLASTFGALVVMIGCAEEKQQQAPTSHPGDALLKDPFGYKPFQDDPSISGGDIGHYDKKGMDRDLHNFWNP
jgi:hypothetical protein